MQEDVFFLNLTFVLMYQLFYKQDWPVNMQHYDSAQAHYAESILLKQKCRQFFLFP